MEPKEQQKRRAGSEAGDLEPLETSAEEVRPGLELRRHRARKADGRYLLEYSFARRPSASAGEESTAGPRN